MPNRGQAQSAPGRSAAGSPPGAGGLRIDVLGPLAVHRNGVPVALGPAMVRNLLAVLAVRAGRTVSPEEIVWTLWADDPPATCANLIHGYVSRLRAQLRVQPRAGPDPDATAAGVVHRDHRGYRLALDADAVDLSRFDRLRRDGSRAGERGDVTTAISAYQSALRCWRGPALANLDERLRQLPAAVAVTQRRIDAVTEYAQLCCSAHQYASAIDELRRVAETAPLHEGLHTRLMLALAGAGDRASALDTYAELRHRLSEELGVDPSADIQAAQLQILRGDVPQHPAEPPPAASAPDEGTQRQDGAPPVRAPARPRRRRRAVLAAFAAAAVVLAVAFAAGSAGAAWVLRDRPGGGAVTTPPVPVIDGTTYAPTSTFVWEDSPGLGTTRTADQWASARVSGLVDGDHNAGFRLRTGNGGGVLVALSGTEWKIESRNGREAAGSVHLPPEGVLRVAISADDVVTIYFNGSRITSYALTSTYPGRGIATSVWQRTIRVRLTDIRSNAATY